MAPVFGWQRLAWNISQHPKVWIPFLLIVAAAGIGLHYAITAEASGPLPPASEVAELEVCGDPWRDGAAFRSIEEPGLYAPLRACLTQMWRSRSRPSGHPELALRIRTRDGRTVEAAFYETGHIEIDGVFYRSPHGPMALQLLEETFAQRPYR